LKNLCQVFIVTIFSGCIWQQSSVIRNDSNNTVFVGHAGGSNYGKIEPGKTSELKFLFCIEVVEGSNASSFGVPQHPGVPPPNVPNDAYEKGRPLYDVKLVITADGLFYESPSLGLVAVTQFDENCEGEIR